jgi:hypothetical protein
MHRIALSQFFSLASLFVVTVITSFSAFIGRPIALFGACLLLAIPCMFVFVVRGWQLLVIHSNGVRGSFFVSLLFWIFIPLGVCGPAFQHGDQLGQYFNWVIAVLYMIPIAIYLGWRVLPHLIVAMALQMTIYHYVLLDPAHAHPLIVSFFGVCAAAALGLVVWALGSGVHRPTRT